MKPEYWQMFKQDAIEAIKEIPTTFWWAFHLFNFAAMIVLMGLVSQFPYDPAQMTVLTTIAVAGLIVGIQFLVVIIHLIFQAFRGARPIFEIQEVSGESSD